MKRYQERDKKIYLKLIIVPTNNFFTKKRQFSQYLFLLALLAVLLVKLLLLVN